MLAIDVLFPLLCCTSPFALRIFLCISSAGLSFVFALGPEPSSPGPAPRRPPQVHLDALGHGQKWSSKSDWMSAQAPVAPWPISSSSLKQASILACNNLRVLLAICSSRAQSAVGPSVLQLWTCLDSSISSPRVVDVMCSVNLLRMGQPSAAPAQRFWRSASGVDGCGTAVEEEITLC